MIIWIKENLGTIFISILLFYFLAMIVIKILKDFKKGKSSCCSSCDSCKMCGSHNDLACSEKFKK